MAALIRPQVAVTPGSSSFPGRTPGWDPGPAEILPSQPGALGPRTGIYVRLPGANFPPAGSRPVDEMGDANIAPGGTGIMLRYTVPDGVTFAAAGIGFTAADETSLAFLSWTILAPDPVSGYIAKPSAIGSVRNLTELVLVVGSSVTIVIQGASSPAAAVTYDFIVRLRGWLYSEEVTR